MKIIIVTFVLLFVSFPGLCQQNPRFHITIIGEDSAQSYQYKWMPKFYVDILKTMKLDYKKPVGFKEIRGVECFDSFPKLKLILSCATNQLYADDGHFMVFIVTYGPFTQKKRTEWKKILPEALLPDNETSHIYQIKNNIKVAYGDQAASDWKKYVTYYPSAEAKNKFNADTAIAFPLKLDRSNYYKEKYKYLDVLFLEKKERSWVAFYCFSDDEGKKNLVRYMKKIEGVLYFED